MYLSLAFEHASELHVCVIDLIFMVMLKHDLSGGDINVYEVLVENLLENMEY